MKGKNGPVMIPALIHAIIGVLSLRYFSIIIYDTVRNSCSVGEMTDQGTLAVTFHPELLKETLPSGLHTRTAALSANRKEAVRGTGIVFQNQAGKTDFAVWQSM